ncbi:MAG: alanine--tRNA ligase-related protein, partial [Patescibacteria group bacterium]
MTAREIIDIYIAFFEKRGHKRIPSSPLVPENDPTTLFTSSGMQPLVPYLLGQTHPEGKRLVDVQNCFRAVDIDEVGDNRHTTFFRMLGNWSLGDYFKNEEIPWLWEFLTVELGLPKNKLYVTVFKGDENIPYDQTSEAIWKGIFEKETLGPKIFADDTNWWSRSGPPDKMPAGEPGGPDTEVYYMFDDIEHGSDCGGDDPTKCNCGKFLEIANSVFMQYQKSSSAEASAGQGGKMFIELPQKNVDFGGGVERLLA